MRDEGTSVEPTFHIMVLSAPMDAVIDDLTLSKFLGLKIDLIGITIRDIIQA